MHNPNALLSEYDAEIRLMEEALNAKKAEYAEKKQQMAALTVLQRMAIALHDATCNNNHTDGCSWHYEIGDSKRHNWRAYAHKRFYEKTVILNDFCHSMGMSEEDKFDMISVLGKIKKY